MGEFVKSLFDLRFEKFITPKIAGIGLVIVYVVVALLWLDFLFSGPGNFVLRLITFLIGLPLSFIVVRIWFEAFVALTKIAENSAKMVNILEERGS